ncbi:hypothetical protein HAX54_006267 [Datura stramonium]|uniref:LOB domain-containing protein n=1 Tax=Datura stramonium TaxID=4076 RepID=A0ABS8TB80_DATST|nr:hypothetical protein [Datura stramonium]
MAETLILEAKIRKENPVHGCLAIERRLRIEIEAHEKELKIVQDHISFCKKMATLQMEKQQLEEELDRSSLASVSPFDAHSMTRSHLYWHGLVYALFFVFWNKMVVAF